MSPRGPPMPSLRPMLMPMPTTATVLDTTVMDTGMVMDTVTVSDTTDTDTVLDTVIMATVWDTTDITWARGLLMPSLKPMLMLTTADTDITVMVMVTSIQASRILRSWLQIWMGQVNQKSYLQR